MKVLIKRRKIVGCTACTDQWDKRPTAKDPQMKHLPLSCRFCRKTGTLYWVTESKKGA